MTWSRKKRRRRLRKEQRRIPLSAEQRSFVDEVVDELSEGALPRLVWRMNASWPHRALRVTTE